MYHERGLDVYGDDKRAGEWKSRSMSLKFRVEMRAVPSGPAMSPPVDANRPQMEEEVTKG